MEYQVSYFGVTEGQDGWLPVEADKTYFDDFYNFTRVPVENGMWIEIRPSQGAKHVYYSYLIRENVYGIGLRSGSNFGLTLRTSEYCRNVFGVYAILDATFNYFFLNQLIKKENSKYIFCREIQEFAREKQPEIEDFIGKRINSDLRDRIEVNLIRRESVVDVLYKENLLDAKRDEENIMREMGNGIVFLSEKTASRREREEIENLKKERDEIEKQKKDKEEEMAKNRQKHHEEKSSLEREKNDLKQELGKSKEKLKQIKEILSNVSLQSRERIEKTPNELTIAQDGDASPQKRRKNGFELAMTMLQPFLLVLIIALLVYGFFLKKDVVVEKEGTKIEKVAVSSSSKDKTVEERKVMETNKEKKE